MRQILKKNKLIFIGDLRVSFYSVLRGTMNNLFNLVFVSAAVNIPQLIDRVLNGEITDISCYVDCGQYISSTSKSGVKSVCVRTKAGIVTFSNTSHELVEITSPEAIQEFLPRKIHVSALTDYFSKGYNDVSGFAGYVGRIIDSKVF